MSESQDSRPTTHQASLDPPISRLRGFLDGAVAQGIPAISVAVATRGGVIWADVVGMADRQAREAARTDLLFGVGSITKTFVTVVILQLIEQGRLRLEDTAAGILGAAVEGIPNASRATVAELLNHTGGIPSWEDDAAWIRDGRGRSLDVARVWGKHDTLAYIRGHEPVALPGERYSYANTNYTLLGLIIEKVTGREVVSEIRERILEPLGVRDIYLEGFEPLPDLRLPHRYHWATPDFCRDAGVNAAFTEISPGLIDATGSNLSVEWAAGGMVATAGDLARYGVGLRDGKLLSPASMAYLQRWLPARPGAQIGHGVFRWTYPGGRAVVGHDGGVLGFSAALYWIEGADAVVAALCNVGTMHSGALPVSLSAVVKQPDFLEAVLQLVDGPPRVRLTPVTRQPMSRAQVEQNVREKSPFLWLNEHWQPLERARVSASLTIDDVQEADWKLRQFAGLLTQLFPELRESAGLIESPLLEAERFAQRMLPGVGGRGRWLIKADHALPVAGSIKARGGLYEVLLHAEALALREGVLGPDDERHALAGPAARALFAQHEIAVGSTGNLGLSIGVMAAALGFKATVHMSSDAKEWKKARLRARGVTVVEHEGDFGAAVAAGREQSRGNSRGYFVDDENSATLFLGYSVAAIRLREQLRARNIVVDADHPLFVYLPCGVGGAPGGITFGLRHVLGDVVHCFFAEPVASPCMLIRLAAATDAPISVREVGLDNVTEADGLAVAQASEFAAPLMRPLVSGVFTVRDADLLKDLYRLEQSEELHIEPSAAAGFRGPQWLLQSDVGHEYLERRGISPEQVARATHILWTTGGAFVPEEEYQRFHARGHRELVGHQT